MAVKRRYRKVSIQVWGDRKFRELSKPKPNAQTLWFYLITGPQTSAVPGMLHVGRAALAEGLGWSVPALQRCWREIEALELGEADWRAPLIWLPKGVDHNRPESFNVVKSWSETFDTYPECALKGKAEAYVHAFLQGIGKGYAEAFTVAMRLSETETETETETGTEEGVAAPSAHPVRDLLAVHDTLFTAKYEHRPARYTAKDAKHAKDLIAALGYREAVALMQQFFASEDPFIARSGHSVGVLASGNVQNRVIAELSGRAAKGDGMDGLRRFANG